MIASQNYYLITGLNTKKKLFAPKMTWCLVTDKPLSVYNFVYLQITALSVNDKKKITGIFEKIALS